MGAGLGEEAAYREMLWSAVKARVGDVPLERMVEPEILRRFSRQNQQARRLNAYAERSWRERNRNAATRNAALRAR